MKELIIKFEKEYWGNNRTLPTLNEFINAWGTRSGKFNKGGELKKKIQYGLGLEARSQNKEKLCFDKPSKINYVFIEKDNKRDFDNITGVAHKLINDALQQVGILKNDNQSVIREMRDKLFVGSKPMIIVRIKELTQEEIQKNEEEKEIFINYGGD